MRVRFAIAFSSSDNYNSASKQSAQLTSNSTSVLAAPSSSTVPSPSASRRLLLRRGFLISLAVCCPALAQSVQLRVLLGDNSATSNAIAAAIERRHPAALISADLAAFASRRGPGAVYVAIGPAALASAARWETAQPLLSMFVSGQSFARLTGGDDQRLRRRLITAIYAEAGPLAQMQLIKAIYRRRVTVGVLLSPVTMHLSDALQMAARTVGLDMQIRTVHAGQNALHALADMADINVLLSVPDREIYSPDSFRAILESTYRRGQAVIGFSTDMVAAGALAAAYSEIEDMVAQMGEVIDVLATGRFVLPQHPSFWRVALNDSVARSLHLVIEPGIRSLGTLPALR